MITWAAVTPTPGISSRRASAAAKGAISASIRVWTAVMSAVRASIRASIVVSKNPWWSVNRPMNASSRSLILARIRARASWANTAGSRWPAINAAIMSRPETGEDVAGDHGELDLGVLQEFLHPVLLPGALSDQSRPVPGQIPQHPDLGRGHERGADHAPFGDPRQPHRVALVGLGSTRQVLDIPGVDQPRVEPGRLQQVERRLRSSHWWPP